MTAATPRTAVLLAALALAACSSSRSDEIPVRAGDPPPLAGAEPVDHLIEPGERHLAHLWRLTRGFDNAAEGYWSEAGDRICFQAEPPGTGCDRIFVTDRASGAPVQISNGEGKTTCAYFLPGDGAVIYASTHAHGADCPPKPDYAKGYVWGVLPEFDLFVHDLQSGAEKRLTDSWGYDAEATVSPRGDRIVFTSTRSGDLDLWTCDLQGGDLRQVTHELGYDGGAFFSADGAWLVYRRTRFTTGKEAEEQATYRELLADWKVRPQALDIWVIRPNGTGARRVTDVGGASFAPFFFPDGRRIVFASNHHDTRTPQVEFDLFAIDTDGKGLERITTYQGFDAFPMFSADGRWLVFASNRGGDRPGQTNLFVAQWR